MDYNNVNKIIYYAESILILAESQPNLENEINITTQKDVITSIGNFLPAC